MFIPYAKDGDVVIVHTLSNKPYEGGYVTIFIYKNGTLYRNFNVDNKMPLDSNGYRLLVDSFIKTIGYHKIENKIVENRLAYTVLRK